MSDGSETESLQPPRQSMTRRTGDFAVLVLTTGTVMLALAFTGSLGLIEALTAMFVIGSIAAAYYVGSAAMQAPTAPAPSVEMSGNDQVPIADLLSALPLPAFEVSQDQQRIVAYNAPAAAFLRLGQRRSAPPRASVIIRAPALLTAIETCFNAGTQGAAEIEMEIGPEEQWRAHIRPVRSSGNLLVVLEDLTPVKRAARLSTKWATPSLKSSLAKLASISRLPMFTASRKDCPPTAHSWRLMTAMERGDTLSARSSA